MELKDIKGVGKVTIEKFKSLGICNIKDLVEYLPSSYVDYSKVYTIDEVKDLENVLLYGCINKIIDISKFRGKNIIKADYIVDNTVIKLTWFNSPFVTSLIKNGNNVYLYGKINYDGKFYNLVNPKIVKESDIKSKYVKPIYNTNNLISNSLMCDSISSAVEFYSNNSLLSNYDLKEIYEHIHRPTSIDDARKHLEKLCEYEIALDLLAYRYTRKNRGYNNIKNYKYPQNVEDNLPFSLTKSQKSTLCSILNDFQNERVMNRLVLGDVGSGKTIVAIMAMYMISKNGGQSVLIAPTEILAHQHFKNAVKYLNNFGVKCCILTSETVKLNKNLLLDIEKGEYDIIISTHISISEKVKFANLRLVVIDEVQKFGVEQKSKLINKGKSVHTLLLSATPVPRSIFMTIFGDLDVSILERAEENKSNIKTYLFTNNKLLKMVEYIKSLIDNNKKCFIVCPRLRKTEENDIYSCFGMYDFLLDNNIKEENIGLVYGSMNETDKNIIIEDFSNGKRKILLATTVVEVGIDIKNVNHIFIIAGDYLGLSTLHQLRGRVGRSGDNAECYIHVRGNSIPMRIKNIKDYNDGVKLAYLDAEIRGYGDIVGSNQSGKNSYDKFNIKITLDMLYRAKEVASSILLDSFDKTLIEDRINSSQDIVLN